VTEGQWFAVLWGPFAIIFGIVLIVARNHISRLARAQRERQGFKLSPNAQSPKRMIAFGIFIAIAGVVFLVGGLTGVFR